MLNAFQRAGYRYMDLIQAIVAERLELSRQLDLYQITDAQADYQLNQFMAGIRERERQRDSGR